MLAYEQDFEVGDTIFTRSLKIEGGTQSQHFLSLLYFSGVFRRVFSNKHILVAFYAIFKTLSREFGLLSPST